MIRTATPADVPRLVELAHIMQQESRYARMQFNADKLANFITYLVTSSDGLVLVAYPPDGVIFGAFLGMCQAHVFSDDLMATDLALFVEPGKRGGVVAARLLESYIGWAQMKGCKIIAAGVSTGVDVEASTRLYMGAGFQPIGALFEFKGEG